MTAKLAEPHAELDVFRAASRRAFFREVDYGEVRFLSKGVPGLRRDSPDLRWDAAEWIAEEADGAAIGLLMLPGVPRPLRPVCVIDTEGQLHVTGFSLADHFANTDEHWAADAEVVKEFCRTHGLRAPRAASEIAKLKRAFKLNKLTRRLVGQARELAPWDRWFASGTSRNASAHCSPPRGSSRRPRRSAGSITASSFH